MNQYALRYYLADHCVELRNLVVMENFPLALWIMKHNFHLPQRAIEDGAQECIVAIIFAVEAYRPERGKFSALVATAIRNRLKRWLSRQVAAEKMVVNCKAISSENKRVMIRAKDKDENEDPDGVENIRAQVINPLKRLESEQVMAQVFEAFRQVKLTDKQVSIVRDCIIGDKSFGDLGQECGITKQAISLQKNKLMKKIRLYV